MYFSTQNLILTLSKYDKKREDYLSWAKSLVEDRGRFLKETRMAFEESHPGFISYLEEHGLTDDEIEYTCLYGIGLRGKEIGNYIMSPSHYNMSSLIRKKLGIEVKGTNLGKYVQRLLSETF